MKAITKMFLLIIIFVANSLLAQNYQTEMQKVISSYERIGQQLSAGSTDGVEAEAQTIITTTSNLLEKENEFPEQRKREFGILLKRINNYSQRLIEAKNLEEMRVEYDVLSHPVIAYAKMFGADKQYYIYACEGDMNLWIQSGKDPQSDPYCDSPCGKVIEKIEK